MVLRLKLSFLMLIFSGGCGSSSLTSNIILSCHYPTSYYCNDYDTGYSASSAQAACTAAGTFSTAATCTTSTRLGSCAITSSGLTLTTRYYAGFNGGAEAAQTACATSSGTWTEN